MNRPQTGALSGDTLELRFAEWPGEGTPIVLLHGLGGNALWWSGLARQLSGRHMIAIDLPGHGESPPPASWDLEPMADEIVTAVSQRWPQSHIWAGHSWGGKLAVAAAADSTTRGLILVDAPPVRKLLGRNFDSMVESLFTGELEPWMNMEEALTAVQRLPQYTPWSADVERAFLRGVQIAANGRVTPRLSREKAIAVLRPLFETDLTASASRLACPVLVISAGANSSTRRPVVFQHATSVVLPGNHWLQINNVDGLASALSSWFAEKQI